MHSDTSPTAIGELTADLFLKQLAAQGIRSSNRHVIDYLPPTVGQALFVALMQLTDTEVPVRITDESSQGRVVLMPAIRQAQVDILPYLVDPPAGERPTLNQGSQAYASCLRDCYAVDAERPRLLVIITPEVNETLKSAQDVLADVELITLEKLLQDVLDNSHVAKDAPLRKVAVVYRAYQDERAGWDRVVERFQTYVDAVAAAPPEEQGARLPMLGCFLPDATPEFTTGDRVRILEDKDQRRRQRGEDRLHDNALLHEFLTQTFNDPGADPEHILAEVLEDQPEKSKEIAGRGVGGLATLDIKTFAGMEQRRQRREKNDLDRDKLRVEGAAFHRMFGESLLVVTSPGPFTVTFGLGRGFNGRKEHAQVGRWNVEKNKLDLATVKVADNALEVSFPIDTNRKTGFSVWRVALTRGPRSLRSTLDEVLVVVYHSSAREVVVEEGRLVSLEDQAWVAEGKRSFHRYTADDPQAQTVEIAHEESVESSRDDDLRPIFQVLLEGSDLMPRVVDERPAEPTEEGEDGRYAYEVALELACTTVRRGRATTAAMRKHDHYLDAVTEIHEGAGRYKVDLDGDTREVWAHHESSADPFRSAQAVGQFLNRSRSVRLDWNVTKRSWTLHDAPPDPPPSIGRYLEARETLLVGLRGLAEKRLPRFRHVPGDAAVPITLFPLYQVRSQIQAVLHAWTAALDDLTEGAGPFGLWHDILLQTDTLRIFDDEAGLTRLVVLPTHPWMLEALATFQDRFAQNVRSAKDQGGVINPWQFALTRAEVQQMLVRTVIEDWYIWQTGAGRLLLTDGPPFHLEFLPEANHVHKDPLDYVSKIVAHKIGRYLRMHPHLRNERRTLRIGFVNPGSGKHLLDGLDQWLRATMQEYAGRIRELPMEQIPAVDVFLFSDDRTDEVGADFERFFREQVSAADEQVIRQALLARIQYRFCTGKGPSSPRESMHICFLHGLVDSRKQQGKTGLLGEWWDGGFGDGLLSTYLRRTLDGGAGHALHSRRGLWVDPKATGLRGALARLMALQRGCRDSDMDREKAIYWETPLPDLQQMAPTYEHADWVVHLDRELSLEIFRRGSPSELPTIIEYTDQEVPENPGYDTITATRHATPYREQLGEILTTADLDVEGRSAEARKAANAILDDINVLSGSWALDFLLGSIADPRTSMRLKGNVGAALVYRWLRRMELSQTGSPVVEANVGPVVPVFISLEELLRATSAAGLRRKDGLIYRYTNELEGENKEAARWCDDLLILYLSRTESGSPSKLFGRVIEVKFGRSAIGAKDKAVAQVKNTQLLLQERLAGDGTPLDAPFRHKQLSLLIKAQLEQAVAMGLFSADVYEFLNVPALSANLARGQYTVDYTIADRGQHLRGDVFLLHTAGPNTENVQIDLVDGVRVVTIPRTLVEWLAFELADSPTLTARPQGTFPRLGRYATVETQTGVSKRHGTIASPQSPAIVDLSVKQSPTESDSGDQAHIDTPPTEAASAEPPPEPPTVGVPQAPTAAPSRQVPVNTSQPELFDTVDAPEGPSLSEACLLPIKPAPYPDAAVVDAVHRLEKALLGHKIRLTSTPSPRETDRGPRLLRVYVRLDAGESINAVRRISEDIARVVGTASSDIHVTNVPERHAIGLDLPLPGLTYAVSFDELMAHPSFDAAQREMHLGVCAGIDVTGRPVWADLAGMPHMLVAGTTGSGKTVFLRNVILTLLLNNSPREMVLRLSSSKPMDFRVFTQAPHAQGREMARDPGEARLLAEELIEEMERRYKLLDAALCDNLAEYNQENRAAAEPYIVAVFDEYSEMVASFSEKSDRDAFEGAIGRLAQKARAAGIHLVVCMQRPDANALKGAIKANILHRFALKLPQNHDSRIILDENGAETLLGQGDLLYKDANSRLLRLQVPFLENATLKRNLGRIAAGGPVRGVDEVIVKTCPKCGKSGPIGELFGTRKMRTKRKDGSDVVVERPQSYCKGCRSGEGG